MGIAESDSDLRYRLYDRDAPKSRDIRVVDSDDLQAARNGFSESDIFVYLSRHGKEVIATSVSDHPYELVHRMGNLDDGFHDSNFRDGKRTMSHLTFIETLEVLNNARVHDYTNYSPTR